MLLPACLPVHPDELVECEYCSADVIALPEWGPNHRITYGGRLGQAVSPANRMSKVKGRSWWQVFGLCPVRLVYYYAAD